jgi:hypothetical protein
MAVEIELTQFPISKYRKKLQNPKFVEEVENLCNKMKKIFQEQIKRGQKSLAIEQKDECFKCIFELREELSMWPFVVNISFGIIFHIADTIKVTGYYEGVSDKHNFEEMKGLAVNYVDAFNKFQKLILNLDKISEDSLGGLRFDLERLSDCHQSFYDAFAEGIKRIL